MASVKEIWQRLTGKDPNPLDQFLLQWMATNAIYPDQGESTHLSNYTDNNNVFTVINKITEPASTVPVYQYDAKGEEVANGKMIARLNNPNPYQSRNEFIEAAMTFYLIFGNAYTAAEILENGLNAGSAGRLDQLPPQWIAINLGTYFDPIRGYSFYPFGAKNTPVDYEKERIMHWKEFNPDYDSMGGHLKGMSRLRPLLKSVIANNESYNTMVKAMQNQGAWGILTMLGEEGKGMDLTKPQAAELKTRFRRDASSGKLTVTGKLTKWEQIGLSMVELEVIKALGTFKGDLYDAYNVPPQLFAGSQDRTYNNYKEAERALWANAICPSLDAYLSKLSRWMAPMFKEKGQYLQADYSGIEALQKNVAEMIAWMVQARSFTKNEIREAVGYDHMDAPGMDEVYDMAGMMPVSSLGSMPEMPLTEEVLKALKINDYRHAVTN